jgi:hypothetical protein
MGAARAFADDVVEQYLVSLGGDTADTMEADA